LAPGLRRAEAASAAQAGGSAATTWLTRDHSQSIRLRTDATGFLSEASAYRPYGVAFSAPPPPALALAKSYIGERRDPDHYSGG
jgi:hypothetical protein